MDSVWLLADGEAVASAQHAGWFRDRRRATRSARRGEVAVVLRPPAVLLGPLDVISVRDGTAVAVRCAGRRPVCVVRPGTVVVMGPGTAERHGVRRGSTVELRWAT
jgi:urease accessory protein UreE